jgi:Tfp pilus assembly protein PilF
LPHLEHLIQHYPDRADVKARMGQYRFAQGEKEEARRMLEEAVEELSNDSLLLLNLARLDLDEHRPARAEQWLRRVLDADPTDVEARFTLVKALQQQGRRAEADAERARHARESAQLNRFNHLLRKGLNSNADERCEIGLAFFRARQERLGVYWLNQALQLDPRHERANQALAEHFEKKGDADSARQYRWRSPASQPR